MCYTLNTTGLEFGYGPGRKVSETRHMVLGWHTETGQPTTSGLDSGRPTLQHRMIPGQVPARARKAQVLLQRKTTLVVIIRRTSNRKENGNARSCESKSGNRSRVVSRGTAPRGTTPRVGNRSIVADGQRPETILLHHVLRRHVGPCYHSHPRH